ncbi:pyridoxal phosphate-dependent aminotransferase [Gudongella sp. DL1XJH-153]|uniref:pyridoxal phosphate-dependent aminotransferase n=1 Tax=Gudongella sp. DL1XJH-153 TaxID=3409804 RepID=UPI003BB6DED8
MIRINERSKGFGFEGGLYDIYQKALQLESEGKSIIHMEIGKPDFDSPEVAKEAAKKALDDGFVHYTEMIGIEPLRKAITAKYKRDYNLEYSYKDEIVVTAGACEAIGIIMLTMMEPGEEILIPSPFFSAYSEQAIIANVNVVEVPLKMENNFSLKAEDLRENITEKTRIILVNTPHNPTGAIIEESDLREIAALAIEKDLLVISDETYDQFVFGGKHFSIASVEGMKERTLVVNSSSKTFSMTGWRIGYVMGPAWILKYLNKVHQNFSTCATSFAQVGAAEAYNNGDQFTKDMLEEFERRGKLVYESLKDVKGLKLLEPKGAFYVFINIEEIGMDESEFCDYILEEAGVAIVPGDSFGKYGKGFIRLCYACSYEQIQEAMDRIKKAVQKLTD